MNDNNVKPRQPRMSQCENNRSLSKSNGKAYKVPEEPNYINGERVDEVRIINKQGGNEILSSS